MHALYPHLKGRTSLAYSLCGKYLFTVGENMMVRRFLVGFPQEEPETVELAFNAHEVAAGPDFFVVAGDSGVAELFDLESNEKVSTLKRTALPLMGISVSADGKWVGLTGEDCDAIVNREDITQTRDLQLRNVRSIAFHPLDPTIAAVSSLDGVVRVLDVAQQQLLGEIDSLVPTIHDFGDSRCTAAAWSPRGEAFALPTKTFDLALVSTHDWLVVCRFSSGHSNAITAISWSPNGRYIASAGKDDQVLIWEVESKKIVAKFDVVEVLQVKWHPHANEISFVTGRGQLYTIADPIREDLHPPYGGDLHDPLAKFAAAAAAAAAAASGNKTSGDSAAVAHHNALLSPTSPDDDNLFVSDREDDLEVVGGAGGYEPSIRSKPARKRAKHDFTGGVPAQAAFQNGSTPWLNQKRYLCMSPVGYVWSVRHSSEHYSATITFFDQSMHREVHFQDNDRFDLAALTSQACIFANSATGKVAVRFHSSLSDNWDTQIDLEVDGGIVNVALSTEVAVVFTSAGFMRTFTLYGTPLGATSVRGQLLVSAAHENEVLVIYQNGLNYEFTYEDVARGKTFQNHVTLTGCAPIRSLFFSEEGEPFIMDSRGVLSTLLHGRQTDQARWVPLLGAPKVDREVARKYWPLGVSETKLLCIVLKGQQQYPAIPVPITDEIELAVPGVQELESQYMVARTQHEQLTDRLQYITETLGIEPDESMQETLADSAIELDKLLLRQFQLACQDQRLNRGLQIVQLIQTPESLQAAAKVASAYELTSLATRILEAIE